MKKTDINITGVDAETGFALYEDDPDIYLAVLRSYVPNALAVIEKLHNVSKETLPEYSAGIHGLKGISAAIGAEGLRERAAELESIAKAGDLNAVLTKNKEFLEDAKNVVNNIQTWLLELDNSNPKPRLMKPDPAVLARLRKSCEAYDMNVIDDVMDELESANYETDSSLVPWLREKINDLDFTSVALRLASYKEEAK